jgi:hypothetical protein
MMIAIAPIMVGGSNLIAPSESANIEITASGCA